MVRFAVIRLARHGRIRLGRIRPAGRQQLTDRVRDLDELSARLAVFDGAQIHRQAADVVALDAELWHDGSTRARTQTRELLSRTASSNAGPPSVFLRARGLRSSMRDAETGAR